MAIENSPIRHRINSAVAAKLSIFVWQTEENQLPVE